MSDGGMLLFILSVLLYSQTNPKFTGLTILDTDMNRSSIVHRVKHMLGVGVGVISTTTLIGSGGFPGTLSRGSKLMIRYSCTKRFTTMME